MENFKKHLLLSVIIQICTGAVITIIVFHLLVTSYNILRATL